MEDIGREGRERFLQQPQARAPGTRRHRADEGREVGRYGGRPPCLRYQKHVMAPAAQAPRQQERLSLRAADVQLP